ncbi:hypothetical protein SAMN05892877_118103 [Rhizobium subbaraonis]|uniref:Uncharacterized protein n=1 Tax=Rhizobium subbaraonis TaxID=908946 RepID=A0A285UVF5_9HYPH|nr:hypothetical protein [Rhizobium subbaraonis]SOC45874.1 hypothetical protein SAMN05892877_118103 [Rhizobium subbaraonis]
MLDTAINTLGFGFFGSATFIGVVGYSAIRDKPQMKRAPNYISWFFLHRKNHARTLLALGLLNFTAVIALVILIGIREGRL